jgi:hypothetical protein
MVTVGRYRLRLDRKPAHYERRAATIIAERVDGWPLASVGVAHSPSDMTVQNGLWFNVRARGLRSAVRALGYKAEVWIGGQFIPKLVKDMQPRVVFEAQRPVYIQATIIEPTVDVVARVHRFEFNSDHVLAAAADTILGAKHTMVFETQWADVVVPFFDARYPAQARLTVTTTGRRRLPGRFNTNESVVELRLGDAAPSTWSTDTDAPVDDAIRTFVTPAATFDEAVGKYVTAVLAKRNENISGERAI